MKIFLIKQIVPLAAFGLALAGAAGTAIADNNAKEVGPVPAFTRNLAGVCDNIQHTCDTDNLGAFCRVGGTATGARLWAKDANNSCSVPVYMIPPQ